MAEKLQLPIYAIKDNSGNQYRIYSLFQTTTIDLSGVFFFKSQSAIKSFIFPSLAVEEW